jgi:DNA-binding NarL/FixJ family response regulator
MPAQPTDTDTRAGESVPHRALRVVVVDADDRTRQSIVGILGIRDRFSVVGSAGQVQAAVELVRDRRPDVVILDPRLPELTSGVSLIRAIRAIDPTSRILALGWSPQLEHEALLAGADGFVRKTFKPGDLAEAIGRCMDAVRAAEAEIAPDIASPTTR